MTRCQAKTKSNKKCKKNSSGTECLCYFHKEQLKNKKEFTPDLVNELKQSLQDVLNMFQSEETFSKKKIVQQSLVLLDEMFKNATPKKADIKNTAPKLFETHVSKLNNLYEKNMNSKKTEVSSKNKEESESSYDTDTNSESSNMSNKINLPTTEIKPSTLPKSPSPTLSLPKVQQIQIQLVDYGCEITF